MEVRPGQFLNSFGTTWVVPSSKVTFESFPHPSKQPVKSTLVTSVRLLGISISVRDAQFPKTEAPIVFSRLDKVTFRRFTQFWNTSPPILVTVSGITTSVSALFPRKALDPIDKTLNPPSSSGITTTLLLPVYFSIAAPPFFTLYLKSSSASLASTSSTVSSVVSSTVSSVSAGSVSSASVGASVSSGSVVSASVSSGTSVASSVSSVVASVSSVCSSGSSWTTVSSVLWSSTTSAAAGSTNWAVSISARSRHSVRLFMFF